MQNAHYQGIKRKINIAIAKLTEKTDLKEMD